MPIFGQTLVRLKTTPPLVETLLNISTTLENVGLNVVVEVVKLIESTIMEE
jgi:hypothetical protein